MKFLSKKFLFKRFLKFLNRCKVKVRIGCAIYSKIRPILYFYYGKIFVILKANHHSGFILESVDRIISRHGFRLEFIDILGKMN